MPYDKRGFRSFNFIYFSASICRIVLKNTHAKKTKRKFGFRVLKDLLDACLTANNDLPDIYVSKFRFEDVPMPGYLVRSTLHRIFSEDVL